MLYASAQRGLLFVMVNSVKEGSVFELQSMTMTPELVPNEAYAN